MLRRLLSEFPGEPVALAIEPYLKTDGHRISFTTDSDAERWADLALEALCLGDAVGHEWQLVGLAAEDLSGWSNKLRAPGAVSVSWQVVRGELP